MVYRNNEPYNDLPLLPPPAIRRRIRRLSLRRCITASRQRLAELKGAGNLIPNQSILIDSIPLQEALAAAQKSRIS